MKKLLTAVLFFVSLAASADHPIDVSILSLISRPQEFDGKLVRVIGYFRAEFEGDAIYLHKQDYLLFIPKNGLWVDLEVDIRKQAKKANNGYVLLEGVFEAGNQGHLGSWSGAIGKVQRIERHWPPTVPPLSNRSLQPTRASSASSGG